MRIQNIEKGNFMMTQEIYDYHCKEIRESIKQGDDTLVQCLNYLKTKSTNPITRRDWTFIGNQLVMSGHLFVNAQGLFKIKKGA